jgi:hypothetical protein
MLAARATTLQRRPTRPDHRPGPLPSSGSVLICRAVLAHPAIPLDQRRPGYASDTAGLTPPLKATTQPAAEPPRDPPPRPRSRNRSRNHSRAVVMAAPLTRVLDGLIK